MRFARFFTAALLINTLLLIPLPSVQALPSADPGFSPGFSSRTVSPAQTDIRVAVLAGIKTQLDQQNGTCFEQGGFSIGNYDKFAAAINRNMEEIVVGKPAIAWLKANSSSANSSHYAPWGGYGDAYIYFQFDPRTKITSTARQTMLHEMTHHIEYLNNLKQDSRKKDPKTGKVVNNPASERNTEYQDQVTAALVKWFKHDQALMKKELPLGTALSAWKSVERVLIDGEIGKFAGGNLHDRNLKDLTGFYADYEALVNFYKSGKCGEDLRLLMYLAPLVPQLDWKLDVTGPENVELGDEVTLSAKPFDSEIDPGDPDDVVLPKDLNARYRWRVPRREYQYGQTMKFTPTESIPYTVTVDLVVPFMGRNEPIAHGEFTVNVKPKAEKKPPPASTEFEATKVEFGGNVPGIWDGGNNPQGFEFKRQKASSYAPGECRWEGYVNSKVWGRLDHYSSPGPTEIDRKIADVTASNKAWGKTTTVAELNISGFKGKIVHSSVAWYAGGWSDAGFRPESVSIDGRGWAFKGKHVVEVGYDAGGNGCWTNSLKPFLMAQATAAQNESKAIIASLTIIERNKWVKVPYTGPPLTGQGATPAPTPTSAATPKPTSKPTPKPTLKPTPKPTSKPTPPRTNADTDKIAGWYKHRSGELRFPLLTGWKWERDQNEKDIDIIISPDEQIGIFVKEAVTNVAAGNENAALQKAAATVAKGYKGSVTQPATVGGAKAISVSAYDPADKQPIWFYLAVHGGRMYYFWAMMSPGTGNVQPPAVLKTILNRVEFLKPATSGGGTASTTPSGKEPYRFFNNGNIYGVRNGPTAPTSFKLSTPYMITAVITYHWNNAAGTSRPGNISIRSSTGKVYGPWQATGTPGQGGVKNANWNVKPNIVLPPGTYTIIDSDPATWAQNAQSNGAGHAFVEGYPSNAASSLGAESPGKPPFVTPAKPPAGNPKPPAGTYVTAVLENRSGEAVHIFPEGEGFGPANKIPPGGKREVRLLLGPTGRIKFVSGRNGNVIATKYWDGDPDNLNRFPRVVFDGRNLVVTTGLR